VNLPARNGVSNLMTAGVWLAGHLLRRRVQQRARQAGVDWPAEDVGIEVSPGLMRMIAITDLLHRIRFSLLGVIFVIVFLLAPLTTEN
jgi:hypothetical protein